MFSNIFKNSFVKQNTQLLGRWKRNDFINRKIDLENINNCGDRVCGDLLEQMKPVTDIFDKKWDNKITYTEFSDEIQKIQKKPRKYKGIQKFYENIDSHDNSMYHPSLKNNDNKFDNGNYSIKNIVDNYNERWNKNLTIEEYLINFTRKHRGAC